MSRTAEAERRRALGTFGEVVREARARLDISQEELGFRSGLDRTYVSGVERGVRNPTVVVMFRLAEGLETKLSTLIKRAERKGGVR